MRIPQTFTPQSYFNYCFSLAASAKLMADHVEEQIKRTHPAQPEYSDLFDKLNREKRTYCTWMDKVQSLSSEYGFKIEAPLNGAIGGVLGFDIPKEYKTPMHYFTYLAHQEILLRVESEKSLKYLDNHPNPEGDSVQYKREAMMAETMAHADILGKMLGLSREYGFEMPEHLKKNDDNS